MYFDKKQKMAVSAVSISVFIMLMFLLIVQGVYFPQPPYFIPVSQRINNAIVLGLIVAFIFPAILEVNNMKWLTGVDKNTPRLLLDITESVRSGVPLIKSLEDASTRNYGPISRPLSTAMTKFRLTSDFKGALESLGNTLFRPVVRRMNTILLEAYETGGHIIDVLDTSVTLFSKIAEHREERQSQTRPYIFIVYLGALIFLIISYVILVQFIGPLHNMALDPSLKGTGVLSSLLDVNYYKSILFWAATLQAIGGGLVAGKIGTGRISAGMIHIVFLLSITILFFNVFTV
jgi:flagellar protein FlaJ